ncbi:hypothetical protein, partial [Geitlerinema sp. PCC 9228]|uniref:hypothetical protein n=1 Tax=Geitlerinema sp. PCC 9228 TaxID=111611 RepID=UPI001B8B6A65
MVEHWFCLWFSGSWGWYFYLSSKGYRREAIFPLLPPHGKYLDTFGSPVALAQGGKTNGDFSRL